MKGNPLSKETKHSLGNMKDGEGRKGKTKEVGPSTVQGKSRISRLLGHAHGFEKDRSWDTPLIKRYTIPSRG